MGHPLPIDQINQIAYRIEQIHHGTPSGIDNTVIAYAQPIWFVRGQPFEILRVASPLTLVIADSGIASPTSAAVQDVRRLHDLDPENCEAVFDAIAALTRQARGCIEQGRPDEMGFLMDENHRLLQRLGVSCPELDRLTDTARSAGALGAKLIGAGHGGNMIALVHPSEAETVAQALTQAGAVRTIITTIAPSSAQE